MKFIVDLSRLNMNPAWSGKTVEVYYMTDTFIEASSTNRCDYIDDFLPFMGSSRLSRHNKVRFSHYHHVATIDYKWVVAGHCNPPFAICQNAFSSWHSLDGQETDTFTMNIVNDASKNGERSLSIGDVVRDVELDRYYVVDSHGYSRIVPIAEESE